MSELKSKYNFSSLMNERHSARNFQKKEIPENLLKEIITTAQRASSWENSQPWNVYVATGEVLEQIRKEYSERSKKKIKGNADMNPGHRTNFSDQGRKNMEEFMQDISKFCQDPKMENFWLANIVLFNSPAIVYFTLNKGYMPYSVYDLGGFGMSLTLAAKDYGIDSITAYELIKYPDILRKNLKVPDNEDVIIGIALGYENDNILNKYKSTRLPLDKFCHFRNKFD